MDRPSAVRQLRAVIRHRMSLVRLGTQLRNRIHAVAADHGYDRPASYWTGPGRGWLAVMLAEIGDITRFPSARLARRRMGACETTPSASTGNHLRDTRQSNIVTSSFIALQDLPPLAGVKLVRPRRCAAAGAPA